MATIVTTDSFEYKKECNISSTLTIEKNYMSISKAETYAQKLTNCIGFCIENAKKPVTNKEYLCHFKEGDINDIQDGMKKWHTYLCPSKIDSSPLPFVAESKDEADASNYQLPKQINIDKPTTKQLTYDTKRAMAWAHFLADIWHKYVNITHKCEFLNKNDNMGDILQHVVIFGGGTRDYILGEEFDDIDMFLNTRELSKLHLLHLRKYHSNDIITQSDSVKCCYWKLYQNKFKNVKNNKEPNNYQLNATFFMHILLNSDELKDKVSVTNYKVAANTVYMMKLLDDVMYHEYNLKGQDLDLADTFKLEIDESVKNLSNSALIQLDEIKKVGKLYHRKSQQLFTKDKKKFLSDSNLNDVFENKADDDLKLSDDEITKPIGRNFLANMKKENKLLQSMQIVTDYKIEKTDSNLKDISLPIHAIKSRERFTSNDFSINILVVFLNEFYYLGNIKYEWNVYGSVDTTYLNDGLKDLSNKLLRTPMFDPLYTIRVQYSPKRGSMHFWRVVKFAARYGSEWTIDKKLKEETIKFNSIWLNEERFTNKLFYETFVFLMIDKYVKKPSDHPKRFKVMNDLDMHKHVVPYFKSKEMFRNCLLDKMKSFDDEYTTVIQQELKKYGYL